MKLKIIMIFMMILLISHCQNKDNGKNDDSKIEVNVSNDSDVIGDDISPATYGSLQFGAICIRNEFLPTMSSGLKFKILSNYSPVSARLFIKKDFYPEINCLCKEDDCGKEAELYKDKPGIWENEELIKGISVAFPTPFIIDESDAANLTEKDGFRPYIYYDYLLWIGDKDPDNPDKYKFTPVCMNEAYAKSKNKKDFDNFKLTKEEYEKLKDKLGKSVYAPYLQCAPGSYYASIAAVTPDPYWTKSFIPNIFYLVFMNFNGYKNCNIAIKTNCMEPGLFNIEKDFKNIEGDVMGACTKDYEEPTYFTFRLKGDFGKVDDASEEYDNVEFDECVEGEITGEKDCCNTDSHQKFGSNCWGNDSCSDTDAFEFLYDELDSPPSYHYYIPKTVDYEDLCGLSCNGKAYEYYYTNYWVYVCKRKEIKPDWNYRFENPNVIIVDWDDEFQTFMMYRGKCEISCSTDLSEEKVVSCTYNKDTFIKSQWIPPSWWETTDDHKLLDYWGVKVEDKNGE